MIIGYARVGTDDQRLDSQTDAFSAADTNKIFADKICGSKRVRPELNKMPDQLREGDVVIVTKYDRLARSLKEVLETVEATRERGAGFLLGGHCIKVTLLSGSREHCRNTCGFSWVSGL